MPPVQTLNLPQTFSPSSSSILEAAVATLKAGGLIIFPTETTYGAGVDAQNQAAVNKLLAYKSRREGKPLSIAVTDIEMAEEFVEVNDSARKLYARFLPGPVTVISQGKGVVAHGVESEFGTLGVRIPDYEFVLKLIAAFGGPITATSANASDGKRPYTVNDILEGLSEKQKNLIDLIIDAGELPHNPPSTVIDTTLSTPVVFRQGEVAVAGPDVRADLELTSHSEEETKNIARRLVLKHWNNVKEKGLMIGANGSLGMGKTIFAKGIAEFLQITDTITSPTYNYMEEYDFVRHGVTGKFFHLDVWKVETEAEMERLDFEKLLQPGHVLFIEWSSNVANYLDKMHQKSGLPFIQITFQTGDDQAQRQLRITEHEKD